MRNGAKNNDVAVYTNIILLSNAYNLTNNA